ncbi:MAG: type II CAAX prenyl endopeptidase Rce1 family protein [Candidatus Limnocylindrales bacterium]
MTPLSTGLALTWRPTPGVRAMVIGAALAGVVWLRALLVGASVDALGVGLVFGAGLLTVGVTIGWRPTRGGAIRATMIGLAGAAALVGLSWVARLQGPALPLAAPAPFWAWATATTLVAAAEEIVLRGALFDACEAAWGVPVTLGVTSVAFALMHVPTYGLPVLPLDLGVGLVLGGLRVLGGGPGAPAVAHVAADLAAWFL